MLAGPRRQLDWRLDPLDAASRWPADRGLAVLHSGRTDARWSRWCVLAEPGASAADVWSIEAGGSVSAGLRALSACVARDDAPWLGFLGYDLAYGLERIAGVCRRDHAWPSAAMRRCPGWLLHDRVEGRWWAGGSWVDDADAVPVLPGLASGLGVEAARRFGVGSLRSDLSEPAYLAQVGRCLAYITAGDVFQVNFTQRFTGPFVGDPRAMFVAVSEASPAWYGAYLEWPGLALASISPELLLELGGDGAVVTRPIKGTRPAETDARELAESAKDAAELAMIVDLLRNDLGRVCAYGSVQVAEARAIERHPTVQHGVATVTGRLHRSRGVADVLRAVMPGGSVTGVPKVRAMQIIDELEPVWRGPYCGAIGWLQRDGSAARGAWNVAIRTALVERARGAVEGRLSFGVGGGIVADSDPAEEYAESLVKARALRQGLARGVLPTSGQQRPEISADLLESMP